MPGAPGPEGELHAHDYRLEVVVERADLGDGEMVVDLDLLEAALTNLTARMKDRDLRTIRPEGTEVVTVEVLARWVHRELAEVVRGAGGQALAVRVWESEVAFGGYRAPTDPHPNPPL